MGGLGCVLVGTPRWPLHHHTILSSFSINSSHHSIKPSNKIHIGNGRSTTSRFTLSPFFALPHKSDSNLSETQSTDEEETSDSEQLELSGWRLLGADSGIISSCLVGLLTGVAVVLFNYLVHEIRDLFWDGIPSRGASWLREEPIQVTWTRVILVPTFGGVIVAGLKFLRQRFASDEEEEKKKNNALLDKSAYYFKSASKPILKAMAACVTLGTGNSLGPEGPSVDIGTSMAKGVGFFFEKNPGRKLSLLAAGSAAGLSSGFNAAVAGCFFAVESVLWPSPTNVSSSLTNTTSMVILSAVIAAVVSEIGLGSEPAFSVPEYDFRSAGELPLYLLLGILCGLVSLALSWCTSYMKMTVDNLHKATGIPKFSFPVLGGLSVGLIALAYPEILYWGFENVDILLESRPFVKGLSTDLLFQLVAVKIVATSLCRASGLVGGYYAPSLFIGAATGMAYGKFISFAVAEFNPTIHLSVLEVASPQAYGLVGMAATLAGVCQVPLTAVLLLFELTQDYRIVLPLLGAVGLSSWISSVQIKKGNANGTEKNNVENSNSTNLQETSSYRSIESAFNGTLAESVPNSSKSSQVENLLYIKDDDNVETTYFKRKTLVLQAMKTRFVTVSMCTPLKEVVNLMLAEKESCAVIVSTDHTLIGLLTLRDIHEYSKFAKASSKKPEELLVSELCLLNGAITSVPWTATPDMDILSAQIAMKKYGINQAPVVRKHHERACPVGLLDSDSISLTYSALATKESLS